MEPASKVSVPLTVVTRKRSKVPERVFLPVFVISVATPSTPTAPCKTHNPLDESNNDSMYCPEYAHAAVAALFTKPDVLAITETPAPFVS